MIKVQAYSVDEIFEKKLYYLIPFHIFTYEKEFPAYNEDTKRLADLKEEYQKIMSRLQRCCEEGILEEYTMQTIIDMSKKVLNNIAADYSHVKEEVHSVMGGKVLNYRTKRIYNRGVAQGISQGISQGALQSKIEVFLKALSKGMTLSEAQDLVDIDDATVEIALEQSRGTQE